MNEGARAECLVVVVPVADLRREPVEPSGKNVHDDMQETQLLFNELLLSKGEQGDWLRVETIEQRKSAGAGHVGFVRKKDVEKKESPQEYDGLVRSAFTFVMAGPSPSARQLFPLSLGTRLLFSGDVAKGFFEVVLPYQKTGWVPGKDVTRRGGAGRRRVTGRKIAETARLFSGTPYLWGGRSMPMPGMGTLPSPGMVLGVDCSGLVNLTFRALDIDVPRDAHEQWLSSSPIDAGSLGLGDLIFLSGEEDAHSINHVMLSLGGERFIEAPNTGDVVWIRTFAEKFGLDLGGLGSQGFFTNGRTIYFGRMKAAREREGGDQERSPS